MKTSIYIPDDRAEWFERAKSELGDSMSAMFLRCLEREIESRRQETGRIVLELIDKNKQRRKKAFDGRWLVGNEKRGVKFSFDEDAGISLRHHDGFSVAISKSGRIVVVSWCEDEDSFEVHENFDEFSAATQGGYPMYPDTLIQEVASTLGQDHVEVLDI